MTSSTPATPTSFTSQDTGITYTQSTVTATKLSASDLNTTNTPSGLDSLSIVYTGDSEFVIMGGKLYHVESNNSTDINLVQNLMSDFTSSDYVLWS